MKSEDPAVVARGHAVLVEALEAVRVCAVLLRPVTPRLSEVILRQLGCEDAAEMEAAGGWVRAAWGAGEIRAGRAFPAPKPVFVRMDGDMVIGTVKKDETAGAKKNKGAKDGGKKGKSGDAATVASA